MLKVYFDNHDVFFYFVLFLDIISEICYILRQNIYVFIHKLYQTELKNMHTEEISLTTLNLQLYFQPLSKAIVLEDIAL